MANPGTKPRANKTKGTPPTATTNPIGKENTKEKESGATSPINFKTDEEFAHEWRVHCVVNKISQIEQFKKMFEFWKNHH